MYVRNDIVCFARVISVFLYHLNCFIFLLCVSMKFKLHFSNLHIHFISLLICPLYINDFPPQPQFKAFQINLHPCVEWTISLFDTVPHSNIVFSEPRNLLVIDLFFSCKAVFATAVLATYTPAVIIYYATQVIGSLHF